MGISVNWLDENRSIVLWEVEGKWTWDDYRQAQSHADALVRDIAYKVDVILDFTENRSLPFNILSQMRFERPQQPEKRGRVVIVGASPFVIKMMDLLYTVNPNLGDRFFTAATLDEARRRLTEARVRDAQHSKSRLA